MPHTLRLALSLAASTAACAIALAPAAAPAATAADHCVKPSRESLQVSGQIRIFSARASGTVYACLRSSGHRTRLFQEDGIYTVGSVRSIKGTFVAFDREVYPACKADCPSGVDLRSSTAVADAKNGTVRELLSPKSASVVRLSPTGAVAYLDSSQPDAVLRASDSGGVRVLDHGAISPGSVGLTGSLVRWTTGTTPHAAVLG